MPYVKDRIDENYSLLRPDDFAYPFIAKNTFRSVLRGYNSLFSYHIKINVPYDYNVACGGKLVNTQSLGKGKEFTYENIVPAWRIDIAIAKFKSLIDEEKNLKVNYLPEDEEGAKIVMAAMQRSIGYYIKIFGKPAKFNGYNVIEIPDGWGSQTGDFYFLQAAAAFKDTGRLHELYHEIGHTWNVRAKESVRNCRWFDEAFGSYFEALSLKEFNGHEAFLKRMEQYRKSFLRNVKNDSTVFYTPITGYGKQNIGNNSYLKGPWSLYILNSILGDEMFNNLIRKLLIGYSNKEIDFDEFRIFVNKFTGRNLDKYFNDWIFGIGSSKQLSNGLSAEEISRLY
jgi:aminopeptidase N